MNIQSNTLYRKHRPVDFENVLGQETIINVLKKSIENKNISHAYLFSGDRGTGKTSTARIFAKSIGANPDDIYEMDAASNRGINEIREIRDSVDILPLSSPYKVYIIDEVHMLTKDAFNALLKTLEEPPKHVVFILATTEKEKVLKTVLSRCQVFDFKNPNADVLSDLIRDIVKKEKVKISDDAILEIAKKGKGSFRDTLSILQKVISVSDEKIDLEKIKNIFGDDTSDIEDVFLEKLAAKDKEGVLEIYSKLKNENFDVSIFVNNIIEKIRESLLLKNSTFYQNQQKDKINNFDFLFNLDINSLLLKKFLEIEEIIKFSTKKEVAFEVFLIDLFS